MRVPDHIRMVKPSLRRSLLPGAAASVAYLVEQAIDRRLLHNDYDDLVLWGGVVSADRRLQRSLGLLGHFTAGITLALVYGSIRVTRPSLPGWLRGLCFVQTENTLLFPAVALMTAVHPAVRRGTLPPLWTWRYFWVEVLRHAAYGVVLGAATPDATLE